MLSVTSSIKRKKKSVTMYQFALTKVATTTIVMGCVFENLHLREWKLKMWSHPRLHIV